MSLAERGDACDGLAAPGVNQELGSSKLHVRWLGRVRYEEAFALQTALFTNSTARHFYCSNTRPSTQWAFGPNPSTCFRFPTAPM